MAAEEEEVDIEGEYEADLSSIPVAEDVNLDSYSAFVDPDFAEHPWTLKENWDLEVDDKSKEMILRILSDEQQKNSSVNQTNKVVAAVRSVDKTREALSRTSHRRVWTGEEKALFLTGVDIYGKSWKHIADLIPSRTVKQIRSYGIQYFKNIAGRAIEHKTRSAPMKSKASNRDQQSMRLKLHETSESRTPETPASHYLSTSNQVLLVEDSQEDIEVDIDEESDSDTDRLADEDSIYKRLVKESREEAGGTGESSEVTLPGAHDKPFMVDGLTYCPPRSVISHHLLVTRDASPRDRNESNLDTSSDHSSGGTAAADDRKSIILSVSETHVGGKQLNCSSAASLKIESPSSSPPSTCDCSEPKLPQDGDNTHWVSQAAGDTNVMSNVDSTHHVNQLLCDTGELTNSFSAANELPVPQTKGSSPDPIWSNHERLTSPDFGVLNSNGELIPMAAPTTACVVDRDTISSLEQIVHFEFFENRPNKTPDRYKRIRNYILDQWEKCKPSYLNKTSVRAGLKQCGDVNCIGRIHAFLEQLGAINFQCVEAVYKRLPITTRLRTPSTRLSEQASQPHDPTNTRFRRRRPKDQNASTEGITTEHNSEDENVVYKARSKPPTHYDPFKLVQCLDFIDSELGAPYKVIFESTATIIMDIHAHICKTEVIGMLGGLYDPNTGCMRVVRSEPCSSISTSLLCEMDPVSQTKAGQIIRDAGLQVIGWYHSHPSFVPNPSLQDIESQDKFQQWFARGGDHFLGVIISPYNIYNESIVSEIRCFTTGCRPSGQTDKVPFKFDFKVETSENNSELSEIVQKVRWLLEMYAHYEHCVDMLDSYCSASELSALEKMLGSIESYLKTADSSRICTSLLIEDIRCVVRSTYEKSEQ